MLKHFIVQELVPEEVFRLHGQKALKVFDARVLATLDRLRDRFGPLQANTWHQHENGHQYRGFRPWDCPVGARFSQHKFGRAVDLVPVKCTAEEMRADVLASPADWPYISALEEEVNWFHFDCRALPSESIKVFRP